MNWTNSLGDSGIDIDFCTGNNTRLTEYYCSPNSQSAFSNVNCPKGCVDGACVPYFIISNLENIGENIYPSGSEFNVIIETAESDGSYPEPEEGFDVQIYITLDFLEDVDLGDIDPIDRRAYKLDQQYDFTLLPDTIINDYWTDFRNWDEKYLAGFFIRPNGDLYKWRGINVGIKEHEYISTLNNKYYEDPSLLVDAENPLLRYVGPIDQLAYELDQQYNFLPDYISENYYYNSRGWNEKYLPNFFIRPNGFLYRWGGTLETSTRIAKLDSNYWDDPSLLVDVPNPSAGRTFLFGESANYIGNGIWNIKGNFPDEIGGYDFTASLYCSNNNTVCAEKYGISSQVELSLKFNVCTSQFSSRLSPAICPPHGTQTRIYIDENQCSVKPDEIIICIPGECSGCFIDNRCIPYSIRLENKLGEDSYCDITGNLALQKGDNAKCQNNYECFSNECSEQCLLVGLGNGE